MIEGLFETHIIVRDLARSLDFYRCLDLTVGAVDERRRIAFLWLDESHTRFLGLWEETASRPFAPRHFAFATDPRKIREGIEWLRTRGIAARRDFGLDPVEPIVHNWVPMASIYFDDPDGNDLELACCLPRPGVPDALLPTPGAPLYLSDWERLRARTQL